MKLCLLLTLLSFNAFAVEFSDITGTYHVVNEDVQIANIVTISDNGIISLIENSPYGSYHCVGTATLVDDMIESDLSCEGGLKFKQKVNLEGITNFETFSANVYSSLYNAEVPMNFTKIAE